MIKGVNEMKDQIIALIMQPSYHPTTALKICEKLQTNNYPEVAKALNELEAEQIIFHNGKGEFGTLKQLKMYVGIIDVKDACGFVKVEGLEKDIYVSPKHLASAMSGDTVLVEMAYASKYADDGRIVEILKRKYQTLVGKIHKRAKDFVLDVMYSKINCKCVIKNKNSAQAKDGDFVKVIITDYNNGRLLYAKVDKIIESHKAGLLAIDMLTEMADLKTKFDSKTLNECNQLDYTIALENRKDLRSLPIVTIDGDDAKDFDDAIYVERKDEKTFSLGVYIADVSEYVKVGSHLDLSAKERSFSCYLPNGVIPMLPFALSNDLCSLKENEDRYVLAVEMLIKDGEIADFEIFKAVINSKGRLTYRMVNEWLEHENDLAGFKMLKDAYDLSIILSDKRMKKGYINFDLNDAKIILDDEGKCIDVVNIIRGKSEKMIEEFMIKANECVASCINHMNLPFIYRIHQAPTEEKVEELRSLLANLDVKIPHQKNNLTSLFFSQMLDKVEEDNKEIVNHLVLKAMAKAKYDINNIGHFGLATNAYTHFTSPIRRYPDLVVHRLIKDYLLMEKNYAIDDLDSELSKIANHTSIKERTIEQLERDVIDLKKAEYMENFIGKTFVGKISSIKNWGIYVELANLVEGMISARYLNSIDYFFDEDHNCWSKGPNHLTLMKQIKVQLISTNIEKGQIDFIYLGDNDGNKQENHLSK